VHLSSQSHSDIVRRRHACRRRRNGWRKKTALNQKAATSCLAHDKIFMCDCHAVGGKEIVRYDPIMHMKDADE
jgi:hypothetical protein